METDSEYFIDPGKLGHWVLECPDMWQMGFLNESKFAWFLKEKGLGFFSENHLRMLWHVKLLRADMVISNRKLSLKGLKRYKNNNKAKHIYIDRRQILRRKKGWASVISTIKPVPKHVELFFHPFRYYPLYHLQRILKLNINPIQFLLSLENYPNGLNIVTNFLKKWSSKPESSFRMERWTNIAELAIATEPCTYETLFNSIRYEPASVDLDSQKQRIKDHWQRISSCYRNIGKNKIEEMRDELCSDAEIIDPNKELHILMRLMKGAKRSNLKGNIGGAMHLLTMAEMLRRASEKIFNTQLLEEDELGFGWIPPNVKKKAYGANRIIDSGGSTANEFIRQFGLDFGVRVRIYVEGDTEYFALNHVFNRFNAVEIINLRGIIAQKSGKGVAFRENLRIDIKSHIFSMILIDSDNKDYHRALVKAAENDEICGVFFLSTPDFEFGNFEASELGLILYKIFLDTLGNKIENREIKNRILKTIANTKFNKEFFLRVGKALPELNNINKGGNWGTEMMEYALKNPYYKRDNIEYRRPLLEFCETAFQGFTSNYHYSRKNFCVNPSTGKMVKRIK